MRSWIVVGDLGIAPPPVVWPGSVVESVGPVGSRRCSDSTTENRHSHPAAGPDDLKNGVNSTSGYQFLSYLTVWIEFPVGLSHITFLLHFLCKIFQWFSFYKL